MGIKTHFLLRKINPCVYLIIFSITNNNMTSVKKNDFAEGMITSGTGYLMTVKNVTSKHTVKLDGDSVAVEAFGNLENQLVSLIWDKKARKQQNGTYAGAFAVQEGQGQFFEVTSKSWEDIPNTYQKKHYVLKDQVMAMFDKYGINPNWTVYDPENQSYKKVE